MKATTLRIKSAAVKIQLKKEFFESIKDCTTRVDKHLNSYTCKINTIKEDIYLTSKIADCAKELKSLYAKIGYDCKASFCQKKNTIFLKKDGKATDFKAVFEKVFADCLELSFVKIKNKRIFDVLNSVKEKVSTKGGYFRLIVDKFSSSLYSGGAAAARGLPIITELEKKILVGIIKDYIMVDDCIRVEMFFTLHAMELKCYNADRKTVFTKNTVQCIDLFKRIPA
jgi:hypothetical protein